MKVLCRFSATAPLWLLACIVVVTFVAYSCTSHLTSLSCFGGVDLVVAVVVQYLIEKIDFELNLT